jgi:hypothetical protein
LIFKFERATSGSLFSNVVIANSISHRDLGEQNTSLKDTMFSMVKQSSVTENTNLNQHRPMCGEVIAFAVPSNGNRVLGLEYCLVVPIITSYTVVVLSHAKLYNIIFIVKIPRHSAMQVSRVLQGL